ncbi:MAG: hypothetical protein ACJ8DI_31080 [Ktedonobacteraceae bacterium]
MTATDMSRQEPSEVNTVGPIRFVEELADEHDYWMSLTDAARITRTSEAMTRRWVTSGRLPVRKEPVGINQRTRLVRASDVARIRPIVDPTAAITDDIHKLDLLSIPRQQAQIQQDHRQLMELVQAIEEIVHQARSGLEQLTMDLMQQGKEWEHQFSAQRNEWQQALDQQQQQHEALAAQVQDIERRSNELSEQGKQQQLNLEQLRGDLLNHLLAAQATMQEMQQHLDRIDQDSRQRADQVRQEIVTLLQQQEERFQHQFNSMQEALIRHDQERKQIQLDWTELQEALSARQETFTTYVEQQIREVNITFEQRWSDLSRERVVRDERMEGIEQRLESVSTRQQAAHNAWLAYQERIEMQDRQIQALTELLQDEQEARRSFSEQFIVQQEQVQTLRRELESLKSQSAEADC